MLPPTRKTDSLPAGPVTTHFTSARGATISPEEVPLSESEVRSSQVPFGLAAVAPPQGESGAVNELARLLVAAEHPVLVADRLARTPAGLAHLVELLNE
jgi:hypothetical protein